jgi:ABC-type transporter Mla MlaB component
VGIFSLFGKKDGRRLATADMAASRPKREAPNTTSQRSSSSKSTSRSPAVKRDTQAALATALKIDAIESEMSSEFVNTTTATQMGNTIPGLAPVAVEKKPAAPPQSRNKPAAPVAEKPRAAATKSPAKTGDNTLAPDMGTTTQFLLGGLSTIGDVPNPSTQMTPVIEEAAIMFANGQNDIVEHLLQAAIAEDLLGDAMQSVWLMLFDLYQITGKHEQFETLSIDYASKFETSPPAWSSNNARSTQTTATAGTTPIVPFTGPLDANAIKQMERIQKLAETYRALRLEFTRVTEVNAEGCGLLLDTFRKLQKSGHDLILVGALELTEKIRGLIEVGRRDDTENAWLLLLELLRLLNRENDFEEISIDYCVTFEVSPPAFIAPQNKVTTAAAETPADAGKPEGFPMPDVVEGRIDNLIVAIAAYSDEHTPAIIDCSQLQRVDFNAAGRLLTGLSPFCVNGKSIEFHSVNHLVSALFTVIGLRDMARVVPRKN